MITVPSLTQDDHVAFVDEVTGLLNSARIVAHRTRDLDGHAAGPSGPPSAANEEPRSETGGSWVSNSQRRERPQANGSASTDVRAWP